MSPFQPLSLTRPSSLADPLAGQTATPQTLGFPIAKCPPWTSVHGFAEASTFDLPYQLRRPALARDRSIVVATLICRDRSLLPFTQVSLFVLSYSNLILHGFEDQRRWQS